MSICTEFYLQGWLKDKNSNKGESRHVREGG